MKRIGRYILSGLTVLSLMLCVATACFWFRSRKTADGLVRYRLGASDPHVLRSEFQVMSLAGGVLIQFAGDDERPAGAARWEFYSTPNEAWLPLISFQFLPGFNDWPPTFVTVGHRYGERTVAVSHWLLMVVFAIAPSYRGIRLVRRRVKTSSRPGTCANCHYDLRATPDRCPECGMIPAKAKA